MRAIKVTSIKTIAPKRAARFFLSRIQASTQRLEPFSYSGVLGAMREAELILML